MASFLFLCTVFYWLEFTAFIWKAKGRHGTHSPFAYFLVDRVRRKKVDFKNRENRGGPQGKTHLFLEKLLSALPDFELINYQTEKQLLSDQKKQLIQIEEKEGKEVLKILALLDLHPESIILVPASMLRYNKADWKALCDHPNFHFSADAWYFGLLSRRPQQAKQHFLLKLT